MERKHLHDMELSELEELLDTEDLSSSTVRLIERRIHQLTHVRVIIREEKEEEEEE